MKGKEVEERLAGAMQVTLWREKYYETSQPTDTDGLQLSAAFYQCH